MATSQRGSSHLISGKSVKISGEMSSEDEGPEEVAFEVSKTAALKSKKEALLAVRREKDLLKAKRRERQLLFQEQKKKRLLPETLLEELYNVPQKQKRLAAGSARGEEEKDFENKKVQVEQPCLQGNCRAIRVKDEATDTLLQQSAMDFVQARLYGPRTQRTTNAVLLSLEKKRGAKQGAAIKFANKKWGVKLKDKAEKANKRFIHKQKLIPS